MEKPTEEFELESFEYIELCNLLKIMGIAETGGMAKIVISQGHIRVDGQIETRKTCKIRSGQLVETDEMKILVK